MTAPTRLTIRVFTLAILCAPLLALGLIAGPARAAAAPSHPFRFTLFATREKEGSEPPGRRYPPPGEGFEDACGVATDSAGDIYVADYYHDAVDVFDPAREYLTQIAAEEPVDGPCGLAVDSSGDVFVNNWHRNVLRFTPTSYPPTASTRYGAGAVIDSARSTGLALDPATEDLYVDDRTYVAEYEASGQPVEVGGLPVQIALDSSASYYGLAVSDFPATAGDVYLADATTNTVKAYDPAASLVDPVQVIVGTGTPQGGFNSLLDSSIAVDQSTGHLYVSDSLQSPFEHPQAVVDEFNAAGEFRGQIATAGGRAIVDAEPAGLAVDEGGSVYVTSGNTEEAVLYGFGPTEAADGLAVSRTGVGEGTVTSQPAGISCGSACKAEYNQGEAVTLTATPAAGSTFGGWTVNGSPAACPGAGVCRLTLGADTEVSAEFGLAPVVALAIQAPASQAAIGSTVAPAASAGPTGPPASHPNSRASRRHHPRHRKRHSPQGKRKGG